MNLSFYYETLTHLLRNECNFLILLTNYDFVCRLSVTTGTHLYTVTIGGM